MVCRKLRVGGYSLCSKDISWKHKIPMTIYYTFLKGENKDQQVNLFKVKGLVSDKLWFEGKV